MTLDAGNGLRLLEFCPADKEAVVRLLDNREIYRHTLGIPSPYSGGDFEKWLASHAEKARQNGLPPHWAIRDTTDQLLGGIGLISPVDGQTHRAEIGYWLGQPFWGRGIMTHAARAVCQHALETLRLVKITAQIFAFNHASVRVVEKCGFELESQFTRHFQKDAEYIDVLAYGLIR